MAKKAKRKPDYNIRAQVGGYWTTIGAGWKLDDGNISLRFNTIPVGEWDAGALMMPPLEEKEEEPKE